jgi:uracil-DNA glycosylase
LATRFGDRTQQTYFQKLEAFVDEERASHAIFPPEEQVFSALQLTR